MQPIKADFSVSNNLFAMLRILEELLPPDDHTAVARLNHDAFVKAHAGVLSAEAMQICSLEASIQSWSKFPNPSCKYGFAYEGETLVGFTVVKQCRLPEYTDSGEMTSLYVHVEHHRRGIGRELLDWAMHACRVGGFTNMIVVVAAGNAAREFYVHTGATPVTTMQRPIFGVVADVEVLNYVVGRP